MIFFFTIGGSGERDELEGGLGRTCALGAAVLQRLALRSFVLRMGRWQSIAASFAKRQTVKTAEV